MEHAPLERRCSRHFSYGFLSLKFYNMLSFFLLSAVLWLFLHQLVGRTVLLVIVSPVHFVMNYYFMWFLFFSDPEKFTAEN